MKHRIVSLPKFVKKKGTRDTYILNPRIIETPQGPTLRQAAAIYCRPPSADPGDAMLASQAEQEAACRAEALAHGYTVEDRHVFIEAPVSGLTLHGRPALTALRKALRAGEIDAIVCPLTHAISPDPDLLARFQRAHNVPLRTAQRDPDRRRFFSFVSDSGEARP